MFIYVRKGLIEQALTKPKHFPDIQHKNSELLKQSLYDGDVAEVCCRMSYVFAIFYVPRTS